MILLFSPVHKPIVLNNCMNAGTFIYNVTKSSIMVVYFTREKKNYNSLEIYREPYSDYIFELGTENERI